MMILALVTCVLVTDTRAGLPVRTEKKRLTKALLIFLCQGKFHTCFLYNWSIGAFSLLDVAETKREGYLEMFWLISIYVNR